MAIHRTTARRSFQQAIGEIVHNYLVAAGVAALVGAVALAVDMGLATLVGLAERNCSDDLPDCAELNTLPSRIPAV